MQQANPGLAVMPQRVGVIDLGSNTTRLVVVDFQPHYAFKLIDEIKETVRLIEGAGTSNMLQPAPIKRALKAMNVFAEFSQATDVPRVLGIATSAVRDAVNQADVLHLIAKETGIDFRVVSGEVVSDVCCVVDGNVQIVAATVASPTVEIWDANRRAGLFRKAFGVDVVIK